MGGQERGVQIFFLGGGGTPKQAEVEGRAALHSAWTMKNLGQELEEIPPPPPCHSPAERIASKGIGELGGGVIPCLPPPPFPANIIPGS